MEKKDFKSAKKTFEKLKLDPSSAAFAEEILDKRLLLKLKKSKYTRDKNFFKLVKFLENDDNVIFNEDIKEQIMLKKERLIILPFIALMLPLDCFMQTLEI